MLGISEVTVKKHRGRVMEKMCAASLPHLVTMAAALSLAVGQRAESAPNRLPRDALTSAWA